MPVAVLEADAGRTMLDTHMFDIIFTDAALEHVSDPISTVEELCMHLRPNGLFVMLVDLSGPSDDYLMHLDVNIRGLHRDMTSFGLTCLKGYGTFCSRWVKGAEPIVARRREALQDVVRRLLRPK